MSLATLLYQGEGQWANLDEVVAQGWKRVEERSRLRYRLQRRWRKLRTDIDLPTAQQTATYTEWLESL